MDIALNPETGAEPRPGRLPVQVVEHLHRLLGGDARTEKMVLDYIEFRCGAKNPNYGKTPCKDCGTTRITNHGFNDPRDVGRGQSTST